MLNILHPFLVRVKCMLAHCANHFSTHVPIPSRKNSRALFPISKHSHIETFNIISFNIFPSVGFYGAHRAYLSALRYICIQSFVNAPVWASVGLVALCDHPCLKLEPVKVLLPLGIVHKHSYTFCYPYPYQNAYVPIYLSYFQPNPLGWLFIQWSIASLFPEKERNSKNL